MRRRWLVAAAVTATAAVACRKVLRPWHEQWGATDEEARAPLPGDDLVAEPATRITRAITVDAPTGRVWPWVIQIGADRGGFYSYDLLENLFGIRVHSADRVVPEWQRRAVGDLVYADGRGRGGWAVMRVVPGEALVLKQAEVASGRPAERAVQGWEFLWTFVLRAEPDGRTRLLIREGVAFGNRAARLVMSPFSLVSFVMTRKMLRGIKQRAERAGTPEPG